MITFFTSFLPPCIRIPAQRSQNISDIDIITVLILIFFIIRKAICRAESSSKYRSLMLFVKKTIKVSKILNKGAELFISFYYFSQTLCMYFYVQDQLNTSMFQVIGSSLSAHCIKYTGWQKRSEKKAITLFDAKISLNCYF